jgi:hypothetical protein
MRPLQVQPGAVHLFVQQYGMCQRPPADFVASGVPVALLHLLQVNEVGKPAQGYAISFA